MGRESCAATVRRSDVERLTAHPRPGTDPRKLAVADHAPARSRRRQRHRPVAIGAADTLVSFGPPRSPDICTTPVADDAVEHAELSSIQIQPLRMSRPAFATCARSPAGQQDRRRSRPTTTHRDSLRLRKHAGSSRKDPERRSRIPRPRRLSETLTALRPPPVDEAGEIEVKGLLLAAAAVGHEERTAASARQTRRSRAAGPADDAPSKRARSPCFSSAATVPDGRPRGGAVGSPRALRWPPRAGGGPQQLVAVEARRSRTAPRAARSAPACGSTIASASRIVFEPVSTTVPRREVRGRPRAGGVEDARDAGGRRRFSSSGNGCRRSKLRSPDSMWATGQPSSRPSTAP